MTARAGMAASGAAGGRTRRSPARLALAAAAIVYIPALLHAFADHFQLLSGSTWHLAGFLIAQGGEPWNTLWADCGIVLGKLLGFGVRDALSIILVPGFAAANAALLVFLPAVAMRLWHGTQRERSSP